MKDIADEILSKHGLAMSKKVQARRREMVDFTDEFKEGLVLFYKRFGKSLIKMIELGKEVNSSHRGR